MKEHSIRTRVMEVSPQWAEKKLAELQHLIEQGIFRQRPVNSRLVDSYASEMARGTWGISHQGIGFDEQGRLLDGQHRLWAVVKSGVTVLMSVTTGLPVSTNGGYNMPTLDIIDRGRNRSTGQQMKVAHGITNAFQVASVCRNIAYIYAVDTRLTLSLSQVLNIYEMYAPSIEAIFSLTESTRQKVGTITAPMVVYHGTHREKAMEFARSFYSKENLRKGSPVLALIKWIENHPNASGRETIVARAGVVSYCIHQFHHDLDTEVASVKDECVFWLGSLNKKHAEIIRKLIFPLRKQT